MSRHKLGGAGIRLAILVWCLLSLGHYSVVSAQADENLAEWKVQATSLVNASRFTEALPLLEKIAKAEPDDAEVQFQLGSALLGQASNTKDNSERKSLRIRARTAFIRSKELGIRRPVVDAMIQGLPVDGADAGEFSAEHAANALMIDAEALFSQGKLDEALSKYQKALQLDATLYHAALFSGDVFMQKGDYAQAEIWYQRAIAIDPNKETAYRYSATPLLKQGKMTEARDRYIEAYITEPYNKFSAAGLVQWGQVTGNTIGHPKIEIPTDLTFDEKGNAQINLDLKAPDAKDGSFAWLSYGVTRTTWRKGKFAKTFPGERTYRHSLAEEADALKSVIDLATSDKNQRQLAPSLAALKKLNDEGLLEAYILLARADAGISKDHSAYLQKNRDKLRRYVVEYVIGDSGE
ncbi:MAG: tetratricopeptide repeat protein [Acidobacteriota bacterium]